MSSTYSSSLRIELIGTGDQAGTWGATTNTNLGTLLESGVCGYTSVSVGSANQALTAIDGAPDEARNAVLALTTSTGANFAVYAPPVEKTYVVYNASSYTATIYNSTVLGNTTAAGTGVAIPAGKTTTVWSDGTNFAVQLNYAASLTLGTDLAVTEGGTGASTAADARTNLGLGTIATQAANSVAITGGSITGITDLAVADGGTGASTAANARTNLGLVIGTDVAPVASPALTGTPTAPTASSGTNTTQIATTAFVTGAIDDIPSPTHGMQVFTSNGTFTIPTDVTSVKVIVTGGGGGASTSYAGGGAGATAISVLTGLTPGNTLAVTVGSGGSSSSGNGTASSVSSGTQSISTITGGGGYGGTGTSIGSGGGAGGTASGGQLNLSGGTGGNYGGNLGEPQGGSSYYGGGSGPYGSGGNSGAAGAAGVVVFEY